LFLCLLTFDMASKITYCKYENHCSLLVNNKNTHWHINIWTWNNIISIKWNIFVILSITLAWAKRVTNNDAQNLLLRISRVTKKQKYRHIQEHKNTNNNKNKEAVVIFNHFWLILSNIRLLFAMYLTNIIIYIHDMKWAHTDKSC
jgi:hypothetical protein